MMSSNYIIINALEMKAAVFHYNRCQDQHVRDMIDNATTITYINVSWGNLILVH